MTYQIYRLPAAVLFSSGVLAPGWKVYFYLTGTTTPTDVYTTHERNVAHTQPVEADSAGVLPVVYLDPAIVYKTEVYDEDDVLQPDFGADPVNDSVLSQASIGSILYPRTSAEISAGVVPVNYAYYPRDGVHIKRFGVVGDGTTDDTAAFQNALDSGEPLYVPRTAAYYKVSAELVPAAQGQIIYGDGYLSRIRQVTANLNVFSATSLAKLQFRDMRVTAVGSRTTTYNGCGIYAEGCDGIIVSGLYVDGHRGNGLMFYNCDDAVAIENWFSGSPVAAGELHSAAGADILFYGSSARPKAFRNHCASGQGVAIMVQKEVSGDVVTRPVIAYNDIRGYIGYGIALYNTGLSGDPWHALLLHNNIDDITGSMEDAGDGNLYWGAGIYIVGAENTTIIGGHIHDVCQDTDNDTLAPAAIGATSISTITIDDVDIDTSAYYGITLRDPTGVGAADGWADIGSGVRIRGTTKSAVHVVERGRVRCKAVVENSGAQGLLVANTTVAKLGFDLDMQIDNCTNAGIVTNYASEIRDRSFVRGSGAQNVAYQNGDDIEFSGVSKDSADTGVDFNTGTTNCRLGKAKVTGNLYGVNASTNIRISPDAHVHANTNNWAGDYGPVRTLDNTGTPSVLNGRSFVTGGTTTITAFDDGIADQVITIRAAHSLTIDVTGTSINGGSADLSVAAGDILQFRTEDGTNWYLIGFMDASANNSSGA